MAAHFGARVALGMGAVATLLAATYGTVALRRIRAEERREELAAAPGERRRAPFDDELPGEPEVGYEPRPSGMDAGRGPAPASAPRGA